ncbi:MAG: hypothetical protein WDO19_11045 [Bacteroidota bacterium]
MKADAARLLYTDDLLPRLSPNTIQVNITAERNTEGCAPASTLKSHKPEMIRNRT